MAVREKTDWCAACGKERLFRRHKPEHWIHLGFTIISGGWWLPVWLCAAAFRGPFRCTRCGEPYRPPATPRSSWMLPFSLVTFALFVLGVGAGRWFWKDAPARKTTREETAVSTDPTHPIENPGIPDRLSASELLHAFRQNPAKAEARFGQAKLTVHGNIRFVPPSRPGGQAWLVFVDQGDQPIAQCLVSDDRYESFEARFGDQPTKATLRCKLLRFSPDGSLTLHRPELVVD